MRTRLLSIATALAFTVTGAQAATFTFDLDGLGTDHSSLHVASNESTDFGLTVTAHSYVLSGSGYSALGALDVDSGSAGLMSNNGPDEHGPVDSWYGNELMKFTLDNGISASLTSVILSRFWATGDYDVFADGLFLGNTRDGAILPTTAANEIAIGARKISVGDNAYHSAFYIGSIAFDYDPPVVQRQQLRIAHVPLPAAGFLLVGALGGLGLMRRRKGAAGRA